jgi:hypothetical protein
MDAFIELSWRAYPGGIILAVGVGMLFYGLRSMNAALRMTPVPSQPLSLILGIRMVIFGVVVGGLAGSWIWHQLWLFVLALAFFGEELLETSIVLFALRRFQRLGAVRRPPRQLAAEASVH